MTDQKIAHFTVTEMLGAGAMGEVYLAHDSKLGRAVAIKVLPQNLCQDEHLRKRFLQEAQSASALNHPNVCTIYEVGETETQQPYLCMEYIDGETLEAKLQAPNPLPIEETVDIICQVLAGLTVAHEQNIVHRDLKPGNISINQRGIAKILDFGLAKRLAVQQNVNDATMEHNLTMTGSLLGTPNYMSPEQALGSEVDHLSDLFSVGVILYQMLNGKLPFEGQAIGEVINKIINQDPPPRSEWNPHVSDSLAHVVLRALAKNKAERFQSPQEMLTAIKEGCSGAPSTADYSQGSPAESDVYISYSALDDQSLSSDDEGWISRFHRNLKVRLQQLAGREVNVYRPLRKEHDENLEPALLSELPKAKSLLTVVSPPFANSTPCAQEVQTFIEGGANADSRLIKVVKTPVDEKRLQGIGTDVLTQVNDHNFFEQDDSGRVLEYEESFGEDLKRRYYEKIYDVAYELNQTLTSDPDATVVETASHPVAYVAVTTSDVRNEYEVICRELTEQGYRVVPDKPLTLEHGALVAEVTGYLKDAELIVQLAGSSYGIVPENAQHSVMELQAAEIREWLASHPAQQFVWCEAGEIADARQNTFLEQLRTQDAAHANCELVEGHLSLLKEAVSQHLTSLRNATPEDSDKPTKDENIRMVYLICDSVDEDATESLENFLFQQGLEVSLPDFDCPQDEVSQLHLQTLCECDAVIIFYGGVRKSWVDIKLRDTLKAAGYGRTTPIPQVAVYIAPPFDKRKERFKSHHAAIVQEPADGFSETKELLSFVENIQ